MQRVMFDMSYQPMNPSHGHEAIRVTAMAYKLHKLKGAFVQAHSWPQPVTSRRANLLGQDILDEVEELGTPVNTNPCFFRAAHCVGHILPLERQVVA